MSDTIGPVHIKDRPGSEMQSRIDAEVLTVYFVICFFSMLHGYVYEYCI